MAEYQTHTFVGAAEGFVVTKVIFDKSSDIEGYVGFLPSNQSIYVVFRGTESFDNWLVDFDSLKTKFDEWPECNCEVHAGFYKAVKAVREDFILEVKTLMQKFPSYQVKTTGHSLGAALAHQAALALIKEGIQVSMINFGQPRVGDKAFAEFSQKTLSDQWRVVHRKDIVPHTPSMDWPQSYWHSYHEMYEDESGIRQCNDSGEDKTCSDQWHTWQLDAADHVVYLGMCLHEGCGNCQNWSFL